MSVTPDFFIIIIIAAIVHNSFLYHSGSAHKNITFVDFITMFLKTNVLLYLDSWK